MDYDETVQIICRNIRFLRKNAAMTQRDMAAIMGISVSSLRKLESGHLPPRLGMEAVFSLAEALGLPPALLFHPLMP